MPDNTCIEIICAPRGGVGKTTIIANYALALSDIVAQNNGRLAILDLDLGFGSMAQYFSLSSDISIVDWIELEPDEIDIDEHLVHYSDSLSILPVARTPVDNFTVTSAVVSKVLNALEKKFTVIVVDTGDAFMDAILPVFDRADTVYMIAVPDRVTVQGVAIMKQLLIDLNVDETKVKIILNRYDRKNVIDTDFVKSIVGLPTHVVVPFDTSIIPHVNEGIIPVLAKKDKGFSEAIYEMVDKTAKQLGFKTNEEKKKTLLPFFSF